jgi:hypothetical protein
MGIDAIIGILPTSSDESIYRKGDKWVGKVEGIAGGGLSEKFNLATHDLFNQEIPSSAQFDDLRGPLMTALSAGFDFFNEVAKTRHGFSKTSHEFLDAMAFVNRREPQNAITFFDTIRTMASIEAIQVVRNFSQDFEKIREKAKRRGQATGHGEFVFGLWETYKNLGGRGLSNQMEKRITQVSEVKNFLINQASLTVKSE